MFTRCLLLVSMLSLLWVLRIKADPPWPPPPEIDIPLAAQTPSLQASPHDPAWAKAAVLSALTPGAGSTSPSVLPKTVIRVMWSPKALYVRFEAEDSTIVVPFTVRDADHFKGDVAEVFLDPAGTQKVWYEFEVTPLNGILDAIYLCTTEPHWGPDGVLDPLILKRNVWGFKEWNCPYLQTAARKIKGGWIVEMAIPPAVLRSTGENAFHPGPLRANFLRYDVDDKKPPTRLLLNWSQVVLGRPHHSPGRMGILHLIP
jgi:hypothetical protein